MRRTYGRKHYEDAPEFPADAYQVHGHPGIAWYVRGWETEPDEDTAWSGCENRTGKLVLTMVGDDARWTFDPEDVTALNETDYCHVCGQIGCGHDGVDRSGE